MLVRPLFARFVVLGVLSDKGTLVGMKETRTHIQDDDGVYVIRDVLPPRIFSCVPLMIIHCQFKQHVQ